MKSKRAKCEDALLRKEETIKECKALISKYEKVSLGAIGMNKEAYLKIVASEKDRLSKLIQDANNSALKLYNLS